MNSFIIAHNVFREALRDRIMYVLVFFALLFIGSTWFLSQLSLHEEQKIIYDLGLASISLFSLIITIFLGSSMLHKEIDKGTIHIILTKPISRSAFIVGKWLGLTITVCLLSILMAGAFCVLVLAHGDPLPVGTAIALYGVLMEIALVTALSIFFSAFTSPLIATVATIIITMIGHMMGAIRALALLPEAGTGLITVTKIMGLLVPNLDMLALHDQIAHGIAFSAGQLGWLAAYSISYTSILLLLACVLFSKKDF